VFLKCAIALCGELGDELIAAWAAAAEGGVPMAAMTSGLMRDVQASLLQL
jgi:hypothetical protein